MDILQHFIVYYKIYLRLFVTILTKTPRKLHKKNNLNDVETLEYSKIVLQ